VAALELSRAEQALRLETFDPAMAARCLLAALGAGPGAAVADRARDLLGALTGTTGAA
jgi:hypothetical protein